MSVRKIQIKTQTQQESEAAENENISEQAEPQPTEDVELEAQPQPQPQPQPTEDDELEAPPQPTEDNEAQETLAASRKLQEVEEAKEEEEKQADNETQKRKELNKYYDLFNYFYKIKNKYEKCYDNRKKKILKSGLSIKEKREQIAKIKRKCIGCRKEGGTIFTITNNRYKAICNANKKCGLNIEFVRPTTLDLYFDGYYDKMNKKFNTMLMDLVKNKAEIVHNIIDEESGLKKFQEQQKQINNYKKDLNKIKDALKENTHILYTLDEKDVMDQTEEMAEQKEEETKNEERKKESDVDKVIDRSKAVKNTQALLANKINQYKKLLKKIEEEPNKRSSYITEALGIYKNDILRLQQKIKSYKYDEQGSEIINKKVVVFNRKIKYDKKILLVENPKIISNKTK